MSFFPKFAQRQRNLRQKKWSFTVLGPYMDVVNDNVGWVLRDTWGQWPCYRGGNILRVGGPDPVLASVEEHINA
jgi:hypothetical protein